MSLEGLFATLLVDAYEDQHIATFDVNGAFLQPELPNKEEKVLLKLKGIFVDIMCQVNP